MYLYYVFVRTSVFVYVCTCIVRTSVVELNKAGQSIGTCCITNVFSTIVSVCSYNNMYVYPIVYVHTIVYKRRLCTTNI